MKFLIAFVVFSVIMLSVFSSASGAGVSIGIEKPEPKAGITGQVIEDSIERDGLFLVAFERLREVFDSILER